MTNVLKCGAHTDTKMNHRSGSHSFWPKLDLNEFYQRIDIFETTNRPNFTPFDCPHYCEQNTFLIDSGIKKLLGLDNKAALGLIWIHGPTPGVKGKLQDEEFG